MKTIVLLYKKRIPLLILVAVLYALASLCELLMPYQMGIMVSQGIKQQNGDIITKSGIIMGALAISALVISTLTVRINSYVASTAEKELKIKLFTKINTLTFEEFASIGTSGLLTRCNSDVEIVSELASSGIYALVNVPITFVGGVVLLMMKDWLLGLIILCVCPIVLAFACIISKRLDYLWERGNALTDEQNRHVRERLSGIRVLRAFDKEEEKHQKIKTATREMVLSFIRANTLSGFINPIATVLLNVATVLIIALSANRISYQSVLTAGDVVSGVQYVGLILNGLLTLSWTITWLPQVVVGVRRINEVLNLKGGAICEQGEMLGGNITVENLTFAYPNCKTPVLKNINFSVSNGEKVAVIGGTGSGKSTLIKVLCGFYPVESGRVNFGGKDYSPTLLGSIRKSLSVALQKSMIFEGSLKENVTCFNNDYANEQILKALSVAQLDGFMQEKGGLDFALKQYGANVSGGQKQRINIARTILRDASVYVFDDSFSALDFLTESALRKQLNSYLNGKTQIIITQRIATAMKCDKIFVMEAGEIIGVGDHEALVKNCNVYAELYRSQMGVGYEQEK